MLESVEVLEKVESCSLTGSISSTTSKRELWIVKLLVLVVVVIVVVVVV